MSKRFVSIVVGLISLVAIASIVSHLDTKTTNNEKASATVAITNLAGNSGGTGVILDSGTGESHVLTNGHVCEVVRAGGLVHTDDGHKKIVLSYKKSSLHDLCLLTVAGNLGVSSSVASSLPSRYSQATISGHPSLLPTIITSGHFSGRSIIDVVIGFKPCTDADIVTDPFSCLFFGGTPIIKSFETQTVSATIKPGSSGSAVYDSSGRIAGLVFAGSGELGYAFIVPLEYIITFLETEAPRLEPSVPDLTLTVESSSSRARSYCKKVTGSFKTICDLLNHSTLYVNE